VIVGGGAAGFAAAERLRALGYDGTLTMLSDDSVAPVDRPNLSKDYLAGTAEADWMPLKGPEFYGGNRIDLRIGCKVSSIDRARRAVASSAGEFPYDRLLLATGAEPVRLDTPGFDRGNVFALRTQGDADAIVAAAQGARSAVLIGAGFIGLEAAAALRHRGLAVHVVARDELPLAKVLGPELGRMLLELHRKNGVEFHLKRNATGYDGERVTLDDGGAIEAQILIVGVGVRPRTALAEQAGLAVDRGVTVDARLATVDARRSTVDAQLARSDTNIYARGRRGALPLRGESVRIEHWVHAERMGQCAASNLLGMAQPFRDVPFFWTRHYDTRCSTWGTPGSGTRFGSRAMPRLGTGRCGISAAASSWRAASVGRELENLKIEAELRALV
jgi:NADPH-dependent 2,4-dienoyl-CoA reductase/sulfur reductase-like enzyme